jgi:hypothetical protein
MIGAIVLVMIMLVVMGIISNLPGPPKGPKDYL